jgi:hypothetical protein
MSYEPAIGDCFRVGEVWQSPRGTLYRVIKREGLHVTLRAGTEGGGRLVKHPWDGVIGWTRPPHHNN